MSDTASYEAASILQRKKQISDDITNSAKRFELNTGKKNEWINKSQSLMKVKI